MPLGERRQEKRGAQRRSPPGPAAGRHLEGRVGSVQAHFNRGALRGWVSGYKLLTYPGPFSPSSCRLFRPIAVLEKWLQQLGAALTLHGMMGLDFIESADTGQPAFIELNPRPARASCANATTT